MTAPNFSNLTLDAVVATSDSVVAGAYVAAILDPNNTQRIFNPLAEGLPVAGGDTVATWLPKIASVGSASVNDQYWAPVPGNTTPSPNTKVGEILLDLTPAPSNVVEASSVMNYKLSAGAIVILATGTF